MRHVCRLKSVKQTANMCNCTPQGIRKAIKEDRLDHVKIGEQYAIDIDDVVAFSARKK